MTSPSGTPRSSGDTPNVRARRGPRHRIGCEVPTPDSDSLRTFRAETAGLSNRLPLPSLESMRAGTATNPHTLTRRYLSAARRIGLPREWAQRHLVWLTRTVDSLWPMEATPLPELERRAMVSEGADDLAELAHHATRCRASLLARRDALCREIAADQLLIARIERELEQTP